MLNDDYILRSDALQIECNLCIATHCKRDYQCVKAIRLNNLSAADVEPVRHGRWIQSTEECGWAELECAECSECGEDYVLDEWGYEDFTKFMNYCPNCGAKMGKEDRDAE